MGIPFVDGAACNVPTLDRAFFPPALLVLEMILFGLSLLELALQTISLS